MTSFRNVLGLCCAVMAASLLVACDDPPKPIETTVGLSVATLVKTSGIVDTSGNTCNPAVPAAPDIQAFWDGLSPERKRNPFVGFELWRNTTDGCLTSRLDAYRALVTFNMASVSSLKGLVTKAELHVLTFALPSGVGGSNPACVAMTGGAGSLERFGPSATLPAVSGSGTLNKLTPQESFPTGNTVFTFPRPWASGPVAGAADPTTTLASGTGGAVFTVDVTGQVNAALNGSFPGMSWMLTSAFEGPLTASVPASGAIDCKTAYSFKLVLTHL
ncbi:hypothetical protein Rhe02_16000 [Rhizocola hellebori]|uniref:Uncharacterized protein n=1 Tax=Rhizocola hellebori TaxID=1392758 RepID=A0A8J3Q583_9ACTN|nr:hypothetical protein [Rhizocola hellebori]GIH03533.1 hypothetical protein Rhe02_16000 [Rhizocola hellebori]